MIRGRNNDQKPGLIRTAFDAIMTVITAAAVFTAACCIYMIVQEKMTGEMAFAFGYKPVIIESGSMEPVIRTGAYVLLKKADYTEVKEGDIITFYTERGYVTHRLVGIDEGAYGRDEEACLITRGDANRIEDHERLRPSQIRGKVTLILNPL